MGCNNVILNKTQIKKMFSNCKTILSIISMHIKKQNISEMNYKKN